ncbi:MAG: hypothetical protein A4E67_00172 [Syntrophaceae bacterium PtaB.Bin038]|nr:MAG: hypothetical protein A4E67_00172 [Syntrophaceae bacterium PtaB.Bin038]
MTNRNARCERAGFFSLQNVDLQGRRELLFYANPRQGGRNEFTTVKGHQRVSGKDPVHEERAQIFPVLRPPGGVGGPAHPELPRLDDERPGGPLQPVPEDAQGGQGHRGGHLGQPHRGKDEGGRQAGRDAALPDQPGGPGPLGAARQVSGDLQGGGGEHVPARPVLVGLPDHDLLRHLVPPHEAHGRAAGRLHDAGKEQGQDLHGERDQDHLQGRGRRRRGEAGAPGGHRVPEEPEKVHGARRPHPQGHPPRRAPGDGKDAACQGCCGGECRALLQPQRLRVRRDVRRPRGGPRA